jgi:hypothetical protein
MKKRLFIGFFLILFLSATVFSYEITLVSKSESSWIAGNWLNYINLVPLKDKVGIHEISAIEPIFYKENLLCEIYHLHPRGHIVVASYKEFIPVKSFSVVSDFDSDSMGYEYVVLKDLEATFDFLLSYVEGKIPELEFAIKDNRDNWKSHLQMDLSNCQFQESEFAQGYEEDVKAYTLQDENNLKIQSDYAQPLLFTRWGQGYPYNKKCPSDGGKKCWAGCVATAMAQIMRYHSWPKKGAGNHSYTWNGKTLKAKFKDSYDWKNMPNLTSQYNIQKELAAISELCYEAGVSVDMDYGTSGSSAYMSDAASALKKHFKYPSSKIVYRSDYINKKKWFNVFKKQIDLKRPCLFAIYSEDSGHAVVVDGYLTTSTQSLSDTAGSKKVHINMGWEGSYDAYYDLDNVLSYKKTDWQRAVVDIASEKKSEKPDLRITKIWIQKSTSNKLMNLVKDISQGNPSDSSRIEIAVGPYDSFYIWTTIKNSGNGNAKNYYFEISYDSNTAQGGPGDLSAGKSTNWKWGPWTATSGTHTVTVEVNPTGSKRINESNYKNNKKTYKFTIE